MKRTTIGLAILMGLAIAPLAEAQGRGRGPRGVPPGHMPPPGECRVWYDGVPPGQQPRPTTCREAERIASRARNARVIYGDDRLGRDERRDGRRAVPRDQRYRSDYPYPDERYPRGRDDIRAGSPAFEQGHRDGITKGREDIRDGDRFDPNRHRWYRSADRGYENRYGSRERYRAEYQEGFRRGYEEAYDGRTSGGRTTDGRRPRIIRQR